MAVPQADRYVLGPPIAAGGMGTVHLGRIRGAEGFSRIVAIKCLKQEYSADSEHLAMFVDEALLASRIRHANVVPTIDACRAGANLWLVMDYVAGESLARMLVGGEPLPPHVVLAIIHDALAGLDAAHSATDVTGAPLGLVHRDVSPQNILVGLDGVARIADFGVAKARNRISVTRDGEFKGKIGYAAPEVIQGAPATERADIYGVGVTLWEALVGRRLFVGENDSAVLYKILEWTPTKVSVAAPALGTAYDDVVARALARDPSKRFASVRDMLDALDACGPRASAREVARVLDARLHAALRERAALVRAFEQGIELPRRPEPSADEANVATATATIVTPIEHVTPQTPLGTVRMIPPVPVTPRGQAPNRGGLVALAIGAGIALTAIAVVVALRFTAARADITSAPAPTSPALTPEEAPTVAPPPPLPLPSPPASVAVAASSAPPTTPTATAPPPHRPRSPVPPKSAPATTTATAAKCNPPYVINASGDKVYKEECFR